MPSSPADPATTLQELAATWDAAYEALVRGDLQRVAALMGTADVALGRLPAALPQEPRLLELHAVATGVHGRLRSVMRQGLDSLRQELARVRQGQRVLAGYTDPTLGIGDRVESRV